GIERPRQVEGEGTAINDVVEIQEGANTTEVSIRKFLQDVDRLISHLIDPKPGYPSATGVISATIYSKDAMTADGIDNVMMAMPVTDAIALVNRLSGIEAFIGYKDELGAVRDTMSTGFKKLIAN